MIDLLLPLRNPDFKYLVLAGDKIYLIKPNHDLDRNEIERSEMESILADSFVFSKKDILKLVVERKQKRILVYQKGSEELDIRLHFGETKHLKRFYNSLPAMKADSPRGEYTKPASVGIAFLLLVYGFIWAGTRESPEDVAISGYSFRIFHAGARLMRFIVDLIGQTATLWIGWMLLACFIWYFYVQYIKPANTIVYFNLQHVNENLTG